MDEVYCCRQSSRQSLGLLSRCDDVCAFLIGGNDHAGRYEVTVAVEVVKDQPGGNVVHCSASEGDRATTIVHDQLAVLDHLQCRTNRVNTLSAVRFHMMICGEVNVKLAHRLRLASRFDCEHSSISNVRKSERSSIVRGMHQHVVS